MPVGWLAASSALRGGRRPIPRPSVSLRLSVPPSLASQRRLLPLPLEPGLSLLTHLLSPLSRPCRLHRWEICRPVRQSVVLLSSGSRSHCHTAESGRKLSTRPPLTRPKGGKTLLPVLIVGGAGVCPYPRPLLRRGVERIGAGLLGRGGRIDSSPPPSGLSPRPPLCLRLSSSVAPIPLLFVRAAERERRLGATEKVFPLRSSTLSPLSAYQPIRAAAGTGALALARTCA